MLHCFYRSKGEILSVSDIQKMAAIDADDIIWVDLLHSTEEEKVFVEHKLSIELFTRQEAEEIESSSKYFENEQEINANLNYIFKKEDDTYAADPVSYILKDNHILIHLHKIKLQHNKRTKNNKLLAIILMGRKGKSSNVSFGIEKCYLPFFVVKKKPNHT